MRAVVDVEYPDDSGIVIDAKQHPVVAVAGGALASQIPLQWLTQPMGILGEAFIDVHQDRHGGTAGQPSHVPLSGPDHSIR